MTLNKIHDVLKNSVIPLITANYTAAFDATDDDTWSLAPDLKNICDLGTKISNATADQFKDYLNAFACGVAKTVIDDRKYTPEKLPLKVDSFEYGGIVQSIKMEMIEPRENASFALRGANTTTGETGYYNDVNLYLSSSFDNKIYEKDDTWSYMCTIPKQLYKDAFTTAENVSRIAALIETSMYRSMNRDESALEHNLLAALAVNATKLANGTSKEIKLVTLYNLAVNGQASPQVAAIFSSIEQITGTIGSDTVTLGKGKPAAVTAKNAIYNPHFIKFATLMIKNVLDNSPFASKKYNDGTISAWAAKSDMVSIFNSAFANACGLYAIGDYFKPDYTTPFWNENTTEIVPTIENTTRCIDATVTAATTSTIEDRTVNNVIGVIYDRMAVGYSVMNIPTRTSYNAHGDFYNIFCDNKVRYYMDLRNIALTFTLN